MTVLRIPATLLGAIHADLDRSHAYAWERVGFLFCRPAQATAEGLMLAADYMPVADEDYIRDPSVGAMMNGAAMRKAMQRAYNGKLSVFHLHRHEHRGPPRFSRTDSVESAKFMPDFFKVVPHLVHGTLLLSFDNVIGTVWRPGNTSPEAMKSIVVVGAPIKQFGGFR